MAKQLTKKAPAGRQQKTTQYMANVREAATQHQTSLANLGITPAQFVKQVEEALFSAPDILTKCSPEAFTKAIRKSCQAGLPPDGTHAVIVPMTGGGARFEAMAQGFKRIMNSIAGMEFSSGIIYEGDEFEFSEGAGSNGDDFQPFIRVKRSLAAVEGRKAVAAWAWGRIKGHIPMLVVMPADEIERHRAVSSADKKGKSPWDSWWDRMAEKTAIKRLARKMLHLMPWDSQIQSAIEAEDDAPHGIVIDAAAESVAEKGKAAAAKPKPLPAPKKSAAVKVPKSKKPVEVIEHEPDAASAEEQAADEDSEDQDLTGGW